MSHKKIILFMLFTLLTLFTLVSNVCSADAIETMETNLNVAMADVILIVVSCAILIVVALDARIAVMCALLIYSSLFILYTVLTELGYSGYNAYYPGVAMMLCIVILCLALLVTYKKVNTPYNVA